MPPKAKRIPHTMTLHGDTRVDNYYWLRDDSRSQPAVLDYLQQENAYGREAMSSQRSLQDRVLKEIIDRIPPKEVSAPYIKNGYRYRQVYEPGREYAIYQRQALGEEAWSLLIDENKRAAHSEFYTLGGLNVAPDNNLLAVTEDFLSRRQYGLRIRHLQNETWLPEVIEDVSPGV
ncbi:MAG: oligopeptidase B, partial [Kluyvera intermedia]